MSSTNNTRIYGEVADIDGNAVRSFWNTQAMKDSSLKSVLLGKDFAANSGILRNERECKIVKSFIDDRKLKILDIGCGVGRWADNLQDNIEIYHGIDFSEEYVNASQNHFADKNNISFFCMSATAIDLSVLLPAYDLIIITGVLMYINDNDIAKTLTTCNHLLGNGGLLYIQESVSVMPTRLTLRDFESKDLETIYNVIYRTSQEYENCFKQFLPEFSFGDKTNLLLDKETGAREETNARWWFLKK